jgi:hypothetical protein
LRLAIFQHGIRSGQALAGGGTVLLVLLIVTILNKLNAFFAIRFVHVAAIQALQCCLRRATGNS